MSSFMEWTNFTLSGGPCSPVAHLQSSHGETVAVSNVWLVMNTARGGGLARGGPRATSQDSKER